MNAKQIFVTLAFLGTLGSLSAQNLVLDYVDGTVEVRMASGAWKSLDVGALLAPDSVVRISDNGVAELSSGSAKIHLGKDGTFQLSQSLAQSQKKGNNNVLGLTNKQVGMLLGVGNPAGLNVANMGARGAAKSGDDGMAWASDDPAAQESDAAAIQAKMDQQDWTGALELTNKALAANPTDPETLQFDKALILSQLGRAAGALKALREADIQPGETHYWAAALLIGSQALETEDYDLVLTHTGQALQNSPEKGVSQSLILDQALAWKAKGDPAKANELLNRVVLLEPQSGAGQEAARLLEK